VRRSPRAYLTRLLSARSWRAAARTCKPAPKRSSTSYCSATTRGAPAAAMVMPADAAGHNGTIGVVVTDPPASLASHRWLLSYANFQRHTTRAETAPATPTLRNGTALAVARHSSNRTPVISPATKPCQHISTAVHLPVPGQNTRTIISQLLKSFPATRTTSDAALAGRPTGGQVTPGNARAKTPDRSFLCSEEVSAQRPGAAATPC
jgi:hypothetical protein